MRVVVRNRGADAATLHILPHIWFRNEWAVDPSVERPELEASEDGAAIFASHDLLGDYTLHVGSAPDGALPRLLFCENETNAERIYGTPATTPFPKDGINDHVIGGCGDGEPGHDRDEGGSLVRGHGGWRPVGRAQAPPDEDPADEGGSSPGTGVRLGRIRRPARDPVRNDHAQA